MKRALAFALSLAASVACNEAAKEEARSLALAIDRYRDGSLAERTERATRVVAQACSHPRTCATKEACLKAITPFVEGLAIKARAKAELAESTKDGTTRVRAPEIDAILSQASEKFAASAAAQPACERALEDQKKAFRY